MGYAASTAVRVACRVPPYYTQLGCHSRIPSAQCTMCAFRAPGHQTKCGPSLRWLRRCCWLQGPLNGTRDVVLNQTRKEESDRSASKPTPSQLSGKTGGHPAITIARIQGKPRIARAINKAPLTPNTSLRTDDRLPENAACYRKISGRRQPEPESSLGHFRCASA